MRKALFSLLALALLCASSAFGQTGDFAPQQTASSPLQLRISDGTLGGGVQGTFKFLATNVLLTASTTNYVYLNISVTPPVLVVNTTGFPASQYYAIATVVTSATQITSLTDSRPAINLNPAGSSSGGGITQVASLPGTCTAGAQYQLTVSPYSYFVCGPANTFTQVALGAQTPAPPMGLYLANTCPVASTTSCFYSSINTLQDNTCSWASSGPTVTCSDGPFTAASITAGTTRGFGYATCAAFANLSTSSNLPISTNTPLTITYVSSTQVTLSGNPANTVASNGCFIWGNPDDTGAAALDTAAQALATCPKVMFGGGYYLFTNPHFYTQPAACKKLGSLNNNAFNTAGNMWYAAGYELEGRGTGPTDWFLTPEFPASGTCANGLSGKGCWVITTEGRWRDLMINGGGNYNASNMPTTSYILESDGPSSLDNFTCLNFGSKAGGSTLNVGLAAFLWTQLYQVNISACGAVAIGTPPTSGVTAIKVSIDNPNLYGWGLNTIADYYTYNVFTVAKYNLVCYECKVFAGSMAAPVLIQNNGLRVKLYHTELTPNDSVVLGVIAYDCGTNAGCILDAEDTYMDMTENGTNTSNADNAIKCTVTCTNIIKNSIIKGSAGTAAYVDGVSTSILYDAGWNTWGTYTLTGQVMGEANSANLVEVTAAKLVLSAGFGASAANTALTGGDFPIGFTITNTGAGQAASPTITYTFPTPLPVAPYSCSAVQLGGTNPTLTYTAGTPTVTGVVFTTVGTPTVNDTEIMTASCVTP